LNVVLRRSLGIDKAIALSSVSKAADGSAVLKRSTRELFFVPWRGVTMVGTDYYPLQDPGEAAAGAPAAAVEKFAAEIAAVAPRARVQPEDVALVHWGALPSDDSGSGLPRKSAVLAAGQQETGAAGLVVVIAEKLTSAPVLSQQVLSRVATELRGAAPPSPGTQPESVQLMTAELPQLIEPSTPSIRGDAQARLAARYGEEHWHAVARQGEGLPDMLAPLHPDVSARGVEVLHAIRAEMALSLSDIVLRRLALADTGHPGLPVIRRCAEIAAAELDWDAATVESEIATVDAQLQSRGAGSAQQQPATLRTAR
jgi:glycerol-3-phosphate dehydrogenase